jgi:hypothetical protein
MDNKLIEDLKTEQKESTADDIAYLQALESTLSEWDSEKDNEDYQSL